LVDVTIPDKAYFRIGEVSRILGVETYVVRYWESEFKTVRPIRTRTDQRRYRRKDLEELLLIRNLLYKEGFTIAGAKKRLLELKKETAIVQPELALDSTPSDRERLVQLKQGLQELKKMIG